MNNDYFARAKKVITDPQVLAVVASKRARQLAIGNARPMVKCDSPNLLDIALLEIAEGLLSYEFTDDQAAEAEAPAVEAESDAE
jgi:DNA-directed RNA polymerase omega subunit